MKIWLDTLPLHDETSAHAKDCDCDCKPSSTMRHRPSPLAQLVSRQEIQALYNSTLWQATPLHTQMCAEQRWLACNPTGSGTVAVLDTSSYRLLDQFRHGRSLAEVEACLPDEEPERIATASAWLHRLGLLHTNCPSSISVHETNPTLTAWLHVTNVCNLGCSYCYIKKSAEHMNEDTARQSIDALFRSASKHHFQKVHLKYAGGEASLHMTRVTALHDYASQLARQHGILLSATLLTNGVVLSQEAIEGLQQRHIRVAISLDGIGAAHDRQRPLLGGQASFKYVHATIHRLLENNLPPHISITVSQRNLDGLQELLSYVLELELSFSLSYYRDNDNATDRAGLQFGEQQMIEGMRAAFTVIERRLPRHSLLGSLIDKSNMHYPHQQTCSVGNNYLVIDQHGGVAKCHANIRQTLTTVANDDPLRVIRADRTSIQNLSVDEKEGCRTCDWRYWCGGGCPLLTYRATGRYDVKSPNCNIYRALFPDALRLEALRLLRYETPLDL